MDDLGQMYGLITGAVTLHTAVLDLLDREGILPRAKSIAMLNHWLERASDQIRANLSDIPFRMVLANLDKPVPNGGPGWTPIVIPGGKA